MAAILHEAVLALDGEVAYAVIAVLAFAEAAAFVGLFVPGELAVLVGGALAAQGRASLPLMIVAVAVAAVAGDSVGYEIGRRHGHRLLRWGPVARRVGDRVARTEAYMSDRGGWVVFAGRWTGVLRAIVPGLAGMTRMPYGRFIVWNVVSGVVWAATFVLIGFVAGSHVERVATFSGLASLAVVAAVAMTWALRRRRREAPAVGGALPCLSCP